MKNGYRFSNLVRGCLGLFLGIILACVHPKTAYSQDESWPGADSHGGHGGHEDEAVSEDERSLFDAIGDFFSSGDEKELTAEEQYDLALDLFYNHEFPDAIKAFEKVQGEHPYSAYAIPAELKIAESYYYDGKYPEALPHLGEFRKAHPAHEMIPYVLYLTGMCHFKEIDLIDRDQTATEMAMASFRQLADSYQESIYALLAKKRLAYCLEHLAEHEFYIGEFYYKTGDWPAAIDRFQGILDSYPDAKLQDKTLHYLGLSYMKRGEWEAAIEYFQSLLENFPQSEYEEESRESLDECRMKAASRADDSGAVKKEGEDSSQGSPSDQEPEEGSGWLPW